MKLKKFAALALAGVMAVSMLAGCAGKDTTDDDKTEPTTNLTADVIAALDEETTDKVTFTYSSTLEDTLKKATAYVGYDSLNTLSTDIMCKFDSKLSEEWSLNAAAKADEDDVKDAASITYVIQVTDRGDYTEKYVVEELADDIDAAKVYKKTNSFKNLPYYSQNYGSEQDYYYTYSYAGDMAVVKVTGATGEVGYAVAFTITRTPTKATVPTKGDQF